MDVLIKSYALISSVPFVSFLIIYYLLLFLGITKKKAFERSVYITSILFYSAVTAQLKLIFNLESGFWWTLSLVGIIMMIIALLQWKIRGKIRIKKIFASTTKLSFLTFGFLYLLFFIIGFFSV